MRHLLLPPTLEGLMPSVGEVVSLQGETMGTGWSLRYVSPANLPREQVQSAVQARLDALVGEMSSWDSGSDLCRYNAAAAGSWCALPADFFTVLAAALDLAAETQGACDPTAGALVNLWGFGPAGPVNAPPSPTVLAEAQARTGWQRVQLDPATQRVLQPGGVQLDLSAIAKGYAVDAISLALTALGIAHHLVEIGGELRGTGLKPDGQPWWVQLEVPVVQGLPLPEMVVALHGLAIATSGDYRQGFTHQGRHYSHTLDPRSGHPVQPDLAAVTVLHEQAMQADALATALVVLGLPAGLEWAEQYGVAARFVQRKRSGLEQHWSSALKALMK
ncbi:MAG: FAD:protein FMN transferase [Pseudomonadota bacterium]